MTRIFNPRPAGQHSVLFHSLNLNHSQAVPATARKIQLSGRTRFLISRARNIHLIQVKKVPKRTFFIWIGGAGSL